MGSACARVVVAEPRELVRIGVRVALEAAGYKVVAEVECAIGALEEALRLEPCVLLVAPDLLGGSGLGVVRQLRASGIKTRCIVLAGVADADIYYRATLVGANGFVLTNQPVDDLRFAIERVARGESALDQEALDHVFASETPQDRNDVPAALTELTMRERSVVRCLAKGLTNRQIASELYLAEKTVRNNVSCCLSKLGFHNRTQLAAYVASLSKAV